MHLHPFENYWIKKETRSDILHKALFKIILYGQLIVMWSSGYILNQTCIFYCFWGIFLAIRKTGLFFFQRCPVPCKNIWILHRKILLDRKRCLRTFFKIRTVFSIKRGHPTRRLFADLININQKETHTCRLFKLISSLDFNYVKPCFRYAQIWLSDKGLLIKGYLTIKF